MNLVVDAHSDLLTDVYYRRLMGQRSVLENHWIPKMRQGGIGLRVAAVYVDNGSLPEQALRAGLDQTAAFHQELEESPSAAMCTTYGDIVETAAAGKTGFILGMEGAEPLGNDLQMLKIFHLLGLRVLGLTHARRNYAADGAPFRPVKSGQAGGLSSFGVELVETAQQMDIIIDVSHLNETGFWDVIEIAEAPVMASHSNARVINDHPRNLTDKQIKVLADKGGVIGINADVLIVGGDGDLDYLLDHLDHLVNIGGVEHVGLGLDYCDYLMSYLSKVERANLPTDGGRPVDGLPGDEATPKIAARLARRGYSDDQINLIIGGNFLRLFNNILG